MNKITISAGRLAGKITLPPSKSHTLRAILFGMLANGQSTIYNYLESPDTDAMIEACRLFGARFERTPTALTVYGGLDRAVKEVKIDAGNSGIVLRFMTAVGAITSAKVVVTGDESCRVRRPSMPLLQGLQQMGAEVSFSPIAVQGPIHASKVVMDGADSQPVSAIMIAASLLEGTTEIIVENLGERPWLNLTLDWLKRLGVEYEEKGQNCYSITGRGGFAPFTYCVPSDLSSLAFPLTAAILTESDLIIEDVDLDDIQGDKIILKILADMGAQFVVNNKNIYVSGPQKLSGCAIDVNDCIDALPILAVGACAASGTTHLYNGLIARKKESDRIASMCQELKKMGADIVEVSDGLIIKESTLYGATLASHNDHRVAMALAVAALTAQGTSWIEGAECVQKTYKNFFLEIERLQNSYAKTTTCRL